MPVMRSPSLRKINSTIFDKAEKLGQTKRVVIFVATLLIFGGAFIYFGYMPKSAEIDQVRNRVHDLERKLQVAKIRAKNIDRIREEYAQTEAKLKEAMKLLPDKKEIPSLLKTITQKGIDSKLEFILFIPGKEMPRNFYMDIPVQIEVRGQYREVAHFLDRVRQMERIVNIRNISMKPEKPLSPELVTRCTAETYRFKVKADEAKQKQSKKKKKKS